MLLQVMGDEFECQLEDESEIGVAVDICRIRKLTAMGQFGEVDRLYVRWEEKQTKRPERIHVRIAQGEHSEDEDDDNEDDSQGGAELDGDVEMEDAPSLVPARAKAVPEVDEEGFTKVVGKKKK